MYHQAVARLPCRTIFLLTMPAALKCSRTESGYVPIEGRLWLRPIHQVGERHRTE
jgi:hypothetical protein